MSTLAVPIANALVSRLLSVHIWTHTGSDDVSSKFQSGQVPVVRVTVVADGRDGRAELVEWLARALVRRLQREPRERATRKAPGG